MLAGAAEPDHQSGNWFIACRYSAMPLCLSEVEFHHKTGPCQDGSTITSGHLGRDKHQQTRDSTDTLCLQSVRSFSGHKSLQFIHERVWRNWMKHAFGCFWQSPVILIWWNIVESGGIKIAWVMAGYCVLGRATASHIEQWQVNMCDPVPRNLVKICEIWGRL